MNFYKIILSLALLCLIGALTISIGGHIANAGPLFIGFLVALAIAFRGFRSLRSLSYTVIIFAAVTTALYYPNYFGQVNGFKVSSLITPLLQLIMFGMGTSMSFKDFAGVIKMPKGVLIGVGSHFIIMPLLGFTLANISGFPPEIAAGILLVGCCPNGMASNVISYLAKANLALSVSVTTISTLLAPFVTPLLMRLLAGNLIEIDIWAMVWEIGRASCRERV